MPFIRRGRGVVNNSGIRVVGRGVVLLVSCPVLVPVFRHGARAVAERLYSSFRVTPSI